MPIPQLRGRDPMLIGICGRAGSGKTAAADYLMARHRFEIAAFADEIKDMLALHFETLGIDYAHLHEAHLKNVPLQPLLDQMHHATSARELMQTLGDWGRNLSQDWWINALAQRIGMGSKAPIHDRIVVSDVRYHNEAAWLLSNGGLLIRLRRDSAAPVRAHSSEQSIDQLPAHIDLYNSGPTLAGFHSLLDGALASAGVED